MLDEFKTMIRESSATLLKDALGVLALVVILFGTLHLPALL